MTEVGRSHELVRRPPRGEPIRVRASPGSLRDPLSSARRELRAPAEFSRRQVRRRRRRNRIRGVTATIARRVRSRATVGQFRLALSAPRSSASGRVHARTQRRLQSSSSRSGAVDGGRAEHRAPPARLERSAAFRAATTDQAIARARRGARPRERRRESGTRRRRGAVPPSVTSAGPRSGPRVTARRPLEMPREARLPPAAMA